jgi:ATP/maltotriose-dependent transcriptional regulator MalT
MLERVPRSSSPVLVGRQAELRQLHAALERAVAGEAGMVLLGGEAGVGKTRLLEEYAEEVRRSGVRVISGACLDLGADNLPYAPITAALRDLLHQVGRDALARLLPDPAVLSRLLPEIATPSGEAESDIARARLFEHVLVLLGRLAAERPLVVIVEDAHWADPSTRDLLLFLIRNLRTEQVLLVVSYRTDEINRRHPWRPRLAELAQLRGVTMVEVPRLDRAETDELVTHLSGAPVDSALAHDVFARSEGNPLFVEAIVSCGEETCRLDDSLRDLLLRHTERLPDASTEVLRVISCGGTFVEHRLLAAVTGAGEGALADALRSAVDANVLVAQHDGYAFRHALIREAVHEDLLPGEHTALHARYAEAIEADPTLLPVSRAAVEAAHHWYSAGVNDRALASAWRAAEEARESAAYAEQLQMIERVLELCERVPDGPGLIGLGKLDLLSAAMQAAERSGDLDRGVRYATAALALVDAAADPEAAATLLERRSRMRISLGRSGAEDLAEAQRLVRDRPASAAKASVLLASAKALLLDDRHAEAEPLVEQGLAESQALGDDLLLARALINVAMAQSHVGDLAPALQSFAAAREHATAAGATTTRINVLTNESDLLCAFGQHERSLQIAQAGIERARTAGLERTVGAFLAINVAEPLLALGRWDEAESTIRSALELAPPPSSQAFLQKVLGDLLLARGDVAGARAALAAATKVAGQHPSPQLELPMVRLGAMIALAEGRPADALATVLSSLDMHACSSRWLWPLVVVGAQASGALAAAGRHADPDLGTPELASLRATAARLAVHGPVQEAWAAAFAAEAERASGSAEPAPWLAALAAWEAIGQPYESAYAGYRAAEALVPKDREAAADALRVASERADALRAQPLLDALGRLGHRARLASGGAAASPSAPGGLTPRELDVIRLLAAGRSNAQIASALFISAKTASVHVSNILAKLGLSSRGEAAAAAYRLGVLDHSPDA